MTIYLRQFVLILIVLLSGCDSSGEGNAKELVLKNLKDPDSAKFGEFTVVSTEKFEMACLTVNAKNSLGGYVGNQEYIVGRPKGETWELQGVHKVSHSICVTMMKKHLADRGLLE
jgi:hypothetical protein